jgi:hypothetical protein
MYTATNGWYVSVPILSIEMMQSDAAVHVYQMVFSIMEFENSFGSPGSTVASVVSPVTVTPSVRGNLPLKLSFDGGAAIEGKIERIHNIEAIKRMPAGREGRDDRWFLRRNREREATWEDVRIGRGRL